MGMFDNLRSDYDIGILTKRSCQTKDMDPLGGTMSFFWLDPAGKLWTSDYSGTMKIRLSSDRPYLGNITYIPTGVHGRFYPAYVTGQVVIYDVLTQPDGLQDLVECKLSFQLGQLEYYEYINNFIRK